MSRPLVFSGRANETPGALLHWLQRNPQDVLFLNGVEQADPIPRYLPAETRCVYVVHDTAPGYWRSAVASEQDLSAIVAVSQTVAKQFSPLLKSAGKLRVIHNGSLLPPKPESEAPRSNDIVFLGGSAHAKGAFDVLSLWPLLLKEGFAGRLHWFGRLDPSFEKRIGKLPASERIIREGRAPRDAIFAAAAASKTMLMLSRVEPFGMSTVEAMGMGCVPLAWDIDTGTKEIVTAETGVFVPLGDHGALAREIIRVSAEHSAFSNHAANRARQFFSENAMWAGYSKLCGDLLENPLRPHSHTGETPPNFVPVKRRYQLLPPSVRKIVRDLVGRSPRLGYLLRDLRGW